MNESPHHHDPLDALLRRTAHAQRDRLDALPLPARELPRPRLAWPTTRWRLAATLAIGFALGAGFMALSLRSPPTEPATPTAAHPMPTLTLPAVPPILREARNWHANDPLRAELQRLIDELQTIVDGYRASPSPAQHPTPPSEI